jgi:carotenoid cleavage dioxygenase
MNLPLDRQSGLTSGGYRPVSQETTIEGLEVTGTLPEALDGSFLTIGANPFGRPSPTRDHMLAGDAMVHGLRLGQGRAQWYRNRWIRTDNAVKHLGGLPTPGRRQGLSDNTNTNVIRHAGRTLALGDCALPMELSEELETVSRIDFDGTLAGGFAAQPVCDPVTGELYAVAYDHELPYVTYLTIAADGRVRRAEPIAMKSTSMMHAFAHTGRHAVLFDLPVTFDAEAAAAGSRVPYTWDENHGARIGVLPREGGDADVLWMEIEPCYVFHTVNAFETDAHIIVDVVRHDRVFDRDPLKLGESAPTLWRYMIDRRGGFVHEQQLDGRPQEFPRVDERFRGERHRFVLTTQVRADRRGALAGPALLRHDLADGTTEVHRLGPAREAGEAVFVPRKPWAPEGDGWVLAMVHDAATDRSELIVLDTDDFAGPPVAVVRLPVRVPHGFHGAWLAAE